MAKKKIYYIDNELNIKQGYINASLNLSKIENVLIDYKNNKIKINADFVSDAKDKLIETIKRQKIVKLAEKYGLKARWINHSLEIESKLDIWYVYENDYGKLVWVHKNRKGRHNNREHIQKVMYSNKEEDWLWILRSINQHDTHLLLKHSKNHMMHLFDMIKTNNVPKMKFS